MNEATARVVHGVVTICQTAKDLGCIPDPSAGGVHDLVDAVAQLERKSTNVEFDHEKFFAVVHGIREHLGLARKDLAAAIGVSEDVLTRLESGKPIQLESFLKIVAFAKVDIRPFIRASAVTAA